MCGSLFSCFPCRVEGRKSKQTPSSQYLQISITMGVLWATKWPPREQPCGRSSRRVKLQMSSQRLKLNTRDVAELGSLHWLGHLALKAEGDKVTSAGRTAAHSQGSSALILWWSSPGWPSRTGFSPQLCSWVIFKVIFRIVEHLVATHHSLQSCCCRDWDSTHSAPFCLSVCLADPFGLTFGLICKTLKSSLFFASSVAVPGKHWIFM